MMAKIIHAVVFFALILTTSITPISSRSAAKSDLIDGNEFLSLFIEQTNINNKGTHYDDLDSSKSTNLDEEESLKDSILTIGSLLSKEDEILEEESSTLYGERIRDQMQRQNYATNLQMHEERTTPSLGMKVNHQEESDSSKRQVVKFVTSGSKIVFLEEIIPRNDSRSNFPSPFNKEQNQDNLKVNSSSSDIKVISVRVSSTVGRSQNSSNSNSKTDDLIGLTPVETIQDNDSPFDDDISSTRNDFINRSHKSEFSIEESEPVTQESVLDSVNGESTNIHSILAPPSSINQSPQQQQQQHKQQPQQQQHHVTAGAGRMQRKQDKLVPFQTVIYHDTHFNKDGSAQPRSVSYSSLAQTIDELHSWKDLDSLLEAKQNVSERLMTKPENFQEHPKDYGEPEKVYSEPSKFYSQPAKMYGEPSKFYSEPSKVYSEPAKIYGQPEKQYGEPSKIYSEPAKVYSEPAKVYSEPAKVYGEPSKVYWPLTTTTQPTTQSTSISPTPTTRNPNSRRIIFNLDKLPYDLLNAPQSSKPLLEPDLSAGRGSGPSTSIITKSHQEKSEQPKSQLHAHSHQRGTAQPPKGAFSNSRDLVTERPRFTFPSAITQSPEQIYTPTPEQNYEVEESVSVMTNGRAHGVQPITPTTTPADDAKVGYVVEGRNYRKYRVEEKTPDGFIVGEYGVVSHNDGSLRGVRYTADSNINPSLIHDALMKFLSL